MASDDLIVGLDIGTSKVCVVVAEYNSQGKLEVLGVGRSPSNGLRKGVVVNIESTLRAVADAVEAAEQMAGRAVEDVYTCIAGAHVEGMNSRGVVAVASRGKEITREDLDKVMEAAKATVLPMDRKIIDAIPQEYIVDGHGGIRDPLEMLGVRLEVEAHIITGSITAVQNVVKCVNRAGFKVSGVALGVHAASEAVLSHDEMGMGTMLIDIGGGTSDIILYRDGAPCYTNVLPLGGNQVTSDLSILLKTPFESAERLKREAGTCWPGHIEADEEPVMIMGLGTRSPILVPRAELCEFIKPRMEEIFLMIRRKVEREAQMHSWDTLGGGVVLTGGGALLDGAVELAQEVFGCNARLGLPMGLEGLARHCQAPEFSACVGVIKHAEIHLRQFGSQVIEKEHKGSSEGTMHRIWRMFFG